VEHLAGYAQTDLLIPNVEGWGDDLRVANATARGWCDEVNSVTHSEIAAIPAVRLGTEREVLRPLPSLRPALRRGVQRKVDRLATVRFGSARYSVPAGLVGQSVQVVAEESRILILSGETTVAVHPLIAPGEVSILDDHYGGPRRAPARAVRPRSGTERAFLQLGPVAEGFLRAAAAAGVNKLPGELAGIVELVAAYGTGVADIVDEGVPVDHGLPTVPVRDLSAYAISELS
jgi:hypothetical protein